VSNEIRRQPSRRSFLKAAGVAAIGGAAGLGALEWADRQAKAALTTRLLGGGVTRVKKEMHVGFTDGWASMPDTAEALPPFWPDFAAPRPFNTYVFGIRDLTLLSETQRADQKGHAQINAPILFADENSDFRIHLHNLGETLRPVGQPDNHTVHFHGFPNQIVYFDGVPDNSLSAVPGRELIYRYIPEDPGTYMYHCHVDDVEHVHMGLTGVVFVRPALNAAYPGRKFAYNDLSTEYDREFAFLLTEMDVKGHFADGHQQDMDWSEFKPAFRLMNGRAWPDTIQPHTDPMAAANSLGSLERLRFQPNSSLIQANEGERVLVRISNLGFEEHSLVLSGIPMRIVGRDAKPLGATRPDYGNDGPTAGTRGSIETVTDRLDIGPGESRDVIFIAPKYTGGESGRQVYPFYDRNYSFAKSGGENRDGIGGARTQVNIHRAGTLLPQTRPTGLYNPSNGVWTYASGTEDLPS
jgi:FtsP/CotA-like multicopper oxidase with cupredoxin domain